MYNDHAYVYVDDEALSREVMELVMTEAMDVEHLTIWEDSTDFLARVEGLTPRPDVFLLDIRVGPIDGYEMLNLLRDHPDYHCARVVAVTAGVMTEQIRHLRKAGFDAAVAKPVRVSSFPDVMTRILKGQQVWFTGS